MEHLNIHAPEVLMKYYTLDMDQVQNYPGETRGVTQSRSAGEDRKKLFILKIANNPIINQIDSMRKR